jgi:dihydropteroate synthase
MAAQGADLVDIGGESTRPGFQSIDVDEEIARVLPALAETRGICCVPISVDTSKAAVARAALAAGAVMVNDVSGLKDPDLPAVVAKSGAWLVLTHNRALESGVDIIDQVFRSLTQLMRRSIGAGVSSNRIIVDPGLGFAKNWKQNFEILRRLAELRSLDFPILVGPSRKGMIGRVLGVGAEDRLEGTAALCAIAIANGADVIRVHDVMEMTRVARMMDAIVRSDDANEYVACSTS